METFNLSSKKKNFTNHHLPLNLLKLRSFLLQIYKSFRRQK